MHYLQPSYKSGYARTSDESEYPTLWKGLVWAGSPSLGNTGGRLYDLVGEKNDAVFQNMDPETDWPIGEKGYALDFDGVDDYLDLGTSPSLSIPENGTIAVWIKPTLPSPNNASWIYATGDNTGDIQFGLWYDRIANKFEVIWGTGGGGFDIFTSTANLVNGVWQHLATTRTGSGTTWTAKLFINGKEDSSHSGIRAPSIFTHAFIASQQNGDTAQVPQCQLGDVLAYNRVLAPSEMQELHRIDPGGVFQERRRQEAVASLVSLRRSNLVNFLNGPLRNSMQGAGDRSIVRALTGPLKNV